MLHLFRSIGFLAFQFGSDFFKILYGRLQIFHNILRKDIGIGEIIQVCQRFIFDPENIQEGIYQVTFSTEGRELKVHTTDYVEEGQEVGLTFEVEDIHVMEKMGF